MLNIHREQERDRIERLRGWIIYILYKARPQHLELDALLRLLDKRNFPLSRRRLSEEIDYLRALKFLKVSMGIAQPESDDAQQTRMVQRYAASDHEDVNAICACLTATGINFQEAWDQEQAGIARVN